MSSITRSSDPKLIPDECPVCLEPILQSDLIGTVKNCSHYYHENCITTWSQHSNSCPSCRRLYYLVEIAVMGKPTHVTKRITVKDKLPVNDAIDNIPSEYVQPGGGVITDLAGSVSEASSSSSSASASAASAAAAGSVCTICTSSQYRPSWRMLSCTSCLSSFHVRCLGISNSVDIWYCPICDSAQENKMPPSRAGTSVMSSIRQSRRSTPSMNSRITEAVFRNPAASSLYIGSSETLAVLPLSGDGRIAGTGPRRPPTGLVIFNTNHELDDNFSDEEERNPVPTSPPLNVVNGGVLLRRELKEKENLSKEESISWDVFDTAKSLQQSSTGTSAVSVSSSTGPATSAGSNHGWVLPWRFPLPDVVGEKSPNHLNLKLDLRIASDIPPRSQLHPPLEFRP